MTGQNLIQSKTKFKVFICFQYLGDAILYQHGST